MAKFGIVYASGSKMIRRIIVPERETALTDGTHRAGPGETMLIANGRADLESCAEHVRVATGVKPPRLRCAVLDQQNNVVDTILADPALDTHPLGRLMLIDE